MIKKNVSQPNIRSQDLNIHSEYMRQKHNPTEEIWSADTSILCPGGEHRTLEQAELETPCALVTRRQWSRDTAGVKSCRETSPNQLPDAQL